MRARQGRRALAFAVCLWCCAAVGQELEPRAYVNLPVDARFLALAYTYADGEQAPAPGAPLQDAQLQTHMLTVGFASGYSAFGRSGKVEISSNRSCIDGSAVLQGEVIAGGICGYGDIGLRATYNFYGAPAMELAQFRNWQPGLVMGASLQVKVPTGNYRQERLLNTGSNIWIVRPGVGLSNSHGRWSYDLSASLRFFEDNDAFFGGRVVSQDPLFQMQAHLIYSLGRGSWLALNANAFRGGRSTLNNVPLDNQQENSRWGLTYSMPLNPRLSLKLNASTGVVTRVGNDADSVTLALQYRL